MNYDVFITCAVTGSGDSTSKSNKIPVTPKEIADASIEAAKEGAAIAHVHVRDPDTGAPSRDPELYKQVVDRIRSSDTDVIINLTAGMGGDIVFGGVEKPLPLNNEGTDMVGASERLDHIRMLLPEICTLDCGTMNFSEGDYVMTNTPSILREMARQMTSLGVRPEIEIFDTGHLVMAKQLVAEGLIEDPVMVQLCMGIPYGAPNDPLSLMAMTRNIPENWTYSAFSIGRMQLPYVAMAALSGGNARVGLEDNIYLGKGRLASNGELVASANTILTTMGARIMSPQEVRRKLKLTKRS
ncbi:NADPH dependent quinone reductase [Alphaproteobacteria bacterium 46_93_T64]|nr:NADPH dependent quinone reductase [Alphaproteobacteria bacterium 46_93_T64]